jgi:hypothetical protein
VHTAAVGDDGHLEPVRTVQVGRHVGAAAPAAAGGYVIAAAGGRGVRSTLGGLGAVRRTWVPQLIGDLVHDRGCWCWSAG